ncbi:hypothetical protein NQ317_005124 [Molorchus minor]|uniref:C2H2-type domain-containing protein n=1 Tax=Molorchus minor TaxID=1323400 RepID=A0ABQ9J098_9CUCU|nr:hypothetical protein NQ317_005124 [Molorchus minor]
MISDYDDDTHFCLKCHTTIIGLDNYVNHRKTGCSKNLSEPPKSPLPSQLLPPDESFNLKADDFFSSLELRSSSKKTTVQSTSGKNFSGILTRSKTTAVIQAASSIKDNTDVQQSKSGKNVWIGGHQLKELGYGDNQSKLIKAVAELERRKEEPARVTLYEESDEDSDDYDYDVEDSSDEDQDVPPKNYTGGKWKPSSPIQWSRTSEGREWNTLPPSYTGGKWKPSTKRSSSPPPTHTKGKWKPQGMIMMYRHLVLPEVNGCLPKKYMITQMCLLQHTQRENGSPELKTTKTFRHRTIPRENGSLKVNLKMTHLLQLTLKESGNLKNLMKIFLHHAIQKVNGNLETTTKMSSHIQAVKVNGNQVMIQTIFPLQAILKESGKPLKESESDQIPLKTSKVNETECSRLSSSREVKKQADGKNSNTEEWQSQNKPDESYTRGKWIPPPQNKVAMKISNDAIITQGNGNVQYWCNPCNRKLASKVVYERHLKSELHFKRTLHDREFDENEDLKILKDARIPKIEPPESIFSDPEKPTQTDDKRRKRKKIFLRCEVCQSKVNRYLIGKHLISHYHCRKGDITTPVARNMALENIHGIILQSPFQCSICKFYCNTHQDFLRHWLSVDHINKKVPGFFFCSFCKYRSADTQLMYNHLVSPEHTEVVAVINRSVPIVIKKINPVYCATCKKEFFAQHTTAKSLNQFICEPCGEGFTSSVSLQRHKQKVHNEKYFICTPCNLKFENSQDAKQHRKSLHHKYMCMEKTNDEKRLKRRCEYYVRIVELTFTITQELTSHLRSKSCKFEENPNDNYRCEKCPFSSNSTSELLFHSALHEEPLKLHSSDEDGDSKAKPYRYKCPVCRKFFPKSSLQAHIRLHTQERPFECKICNTKFVRKNNLQFHVKNHEKREVREKCYGCSRGKIVSMFYLRSQLQEKVSK